MIGNVLKRFSLISGLEGEKLSRWTPLCEDAVDFCSSHLTKSELSENQERCFCNLAAAFAYYKFCICDFDGVNTFVAGDVQIRKSDVAENAKRIWDNELLLCRDFVDLGGFCFFGVS